MKDTLVYVSTSPPALLHLHHPTLHFLRTDQASNRLLLLQVLDKRTLPDLGLRCWFFAFCVRYAEVGIYTR